MSKKEKKLGIGALWDAVQSWWFDSPIKALAAFGKFFMFVRQRKVYWLMQAINLSYKKDQQEFLKHIASETGQQLLEEFVDTTLATSSKTAIAALGILFADIEHGKYDEDFKRLACKAFKGITDDLVSTFLPLCELKPIGANDMIWIANSETDKTAKPTQPGCPYDIARLDSVITEKTPELKHVIKMPEDAFASIHELIRRGMFLPDHASSRTGSEGDWEIFFGVTRTSRRLKELLLQAKSISEQLKNEPVMESQEDD